jgi:hypothetical protein
MLFEYHYWRCCSAPTKLRLIVADEMQQRVFRPTDELLLRLPPHVVVGHIHILNYTHFIFEVCDDSPGNCQFLGILMLQKKRKCSAKNVTRIQKNTSYIFAAYVLTCFLFSCSFSCKIFIFTLIIIGAHFTLGRFL